MAAVPGEKQDRYEQLLTKYDWHAARPPRGYQYGVGRGARPFSTTAELSIGVNVGADTREESDFFHAMDRLEAKPKRKPQQRRPSEEPSEGDHKDGRPASSSSPPLAPKLSLDDLVGLESLSSTVIAPGGLVSRSARTEEGDLAEQYLFSDESSVITANDVLRGKSSTKEVALANLLEMGSPEEQSTWVTRARALRELGLARKAHEALMEGCAVTGKKGTLIWEERLRYVSATENPLARRRLLEEATAACPSAERLWLERIDSLPRPQQLACVQQAVLACPTSELLWLRVLDVTPSAADQRKLIQRAVQRSPNQPRLWGKLARLVPYDAGRDIFRQIGQQHPSLELAMEACKFVEDHLAPAATTTTTTPPAETTTTTTTTAAAAATAVAQHVFTRLRTSEGFDEMSEQVHAAQQRYLDVSKDWSRQQWLALAKEAATGLRDDQDAAPAVPWTARAIHVWSAAFFILYCARPSAARTLTLLSTAAASSSAPDLRLSSTWVEDLLSFLPGVMDDHAVLSAVCGAFLLQLLPHFARSPALNAAATASPTAGWPILSVAATPLETRERFASLLRLLRRALEVAPASELRFAAEGVCAAAAAAAAAAASNTPARTLANEEEEEEELGGRGTVLSVPTVPPSSHTQSPLLTVLVAVSESLLEPFTLAAQASSDATQAALAQGAALVEAAQLQSRLALVVASGFRGRGEYEAALAILERAETCLVASLELTRLPDASALHLRPADQARLEDSLLHVLVACAGSHAQLGHALEVAQYLSRGATQCPNAGSDVAWVGLLLQLGATGTGTDADAQAHQLTTLQQALDAQPRSTALWRLRLSIAAQVLRVARTSPETHSAASLARLTQELRQLCQRALSAAHCRTSAALWAYVAVTVEAHVLGSGPAARALLAEAATVCCPERHTLLLSSSADKRAEHARAVLGLALARVELVQGGGREPAHEAVANTLRLLPKTKEGAFLLPVGELQQLYVDLEAPAQRGRAALQVMQQWKSREPLALVAIAKFYHLAKHYDRALAEAIKAVKLSRVPVMANHSDDTYTCSGGPGAGMDDTSHKADDGRPRRGGGARGRATNHSNHCEDDLAMLPLSLSAYYHVHSHVQPDVLYADPLVLLWKLASLPEYAKLVAARLGTFSDEELEAVTTLPEEVIHEWVFSLAAEALCGTSADTSTSSTALSAPERQEAQRAALKRLVPNAGPVWLSVTEDGDGGASSLPSAGVSLIGYRQDTETLLRKAMAQLVL